MREIKGRLLYLGWNNTPWRVITDNGEIDLQPIVAEFLMSINKERAVQKQKKEGYILKTSKRSKFRLRYAPDEYIILERINGFGGSNVWTYLDATFIRLTGRLVHIKVEMGKKFQIFPDKNEKVFGVYSTGERNSCKLPEGIEKTVCKINQEDCCIFLSLHEDGFYCEKFNIPVARFLLNRFAKGEMSAKKIGNCALLGRKK